MTESLLAENKLLRERAEKAEALERALKAHAACATCINLANCKRMDVGLCRGKFYDYSAWRFDIGRYNVHEQEVTT